MSSSKSKIISEDWVVVILGLALIFTALFGIIVPSPSFPWTSAAELSAKVLSPDNLLIAGEQFLLVFATALIGAFLLGKRLKSLLVVFPLIFVLTICALILAGNSTLQEYNLEAVIFSLGIGLLISNIFKLPSWFKEALSTELYVKIGLVLLGTTVIFGDILKAGSLGLIQALVVVLSVWYLKWIKKWR